MAMQRTITADIDAGAPDVYAALATLDHYPDWLGLVYAVEDAPAAPADAGRAWFVTLRATVGPFARSKRLRMQRTVDDAPGHVRFERAERDGRSHSPWTLDVHVVETGAATSRVRVELSYEGGLWTTPLEAVLRSHVDDAVPRLQAHLRA